jgi:methyl-accepting chemotaxis protein
MRSLAMFRLLRSVEASSDPREAAHSQEAALPVTATPEGEILSLRQALNTDIRVGILLAGAAKDDLAAACKTAQTGLQNIAGDLDAIETVREESGLHLTAVSHGLDVLQRSHDNLHSALAEEEKSIATALASQADIQAIIADLQRDMAHHASLASNLSQLARQSSRLAMSATIEAAKSGQMAGKPGASKGGIADVAMQICELANAMGHAAEDLKTHIHELTRKCDTAPASLIRQQESVQETRETLKRARSTLSECTHLTAETAGRMAGIVQTTNHMAQMARRSRSGLIEIGQTFQSEAERPNGFGETAAALERRLEASLRYRSSAPLRRNPRYPVHLGARIEPGHLQTSTLDISETGLLLRAPSGCHLAKGTVIDVTIAGADPVPVEIVATGPRGLHGAFLPCEAKAQEGLRAILNAARADYGPMVEKAQDLAAEIATLMLRQSEKRGTDWFSDAYSPIPGTHPCQFLVPWLEDAESLLPDLLDAPLASDARLVFCVVTDRNGYVPVHQRRHAQSQRPEDPLWNHVHCRNRRFFDDHNGISAARSEQVFLLQSYERDMGGGVSVLMREVDVPLTLNTRHWGALRMAYRL